MRYLLRSGSTIETEKPIRPRHYLSCIIFIGMMVTGLEGLAAQSQTLVRSGIYRRLPPPPPAFRLCGRPDQPPCPRDDSGETDENISAPSPVDFFSQVGAGFSFLDAPGIEVALTLLSIEVVGKITSTQLRDNAGNPTELFKVDTSYWGIRVLNRTAVSADSLRSLANDYLTSLQPAPVTVRAEYPLHLSTLPVFNIRADLRGVPYADSSRNVRFAPSGHLFVGTALSRSARRVADGRVIDTGEVYFEPTLYLTYGGADLMQSIRPSAGTGMFTGAEVRFGYKSLRNRAFDIGLLGRCAFVDLIGPRCRLTLTGSSNP